MDEAGARGAKHGANVPLKSAAVTARASLRPETRSLTLGGDDHPIDEEAGSERRFDGDVGPFTLEEFEAFYGAEEASKRWESAGRTAR